MLWDTGAFLTCCPAEVGAEAFNLFELNRFVVRDKLAGSEELAMHSLKAGLRQLGYPSIRVVKLSRLSRGAVKGSIVLGRTPALSLRFVTSEELQKAPPEVM